MDYLSLGTTLHNSEDLSQASDVDPLAVYGLVLDHDLNEKSSLFRVDSQTNNRDGDLKDLEYLGNGFGPMLGTLCITLNQIGVLL